MTWRNGVTAMALAGCIVLTGPAGDVKAACSRSDVEFYLDKGFSHEQITAICSGTEAQTVTEPEVKSGEAEIRQSETGKPETRSEAAAETARNDAAFLAEAIKGYDVEVGTESLKYTTKDCFEYGEEDNNGFRKRICPEVRSSIDFEGMQLKRSGRKEFLYGPRVIVVKGRIEHQILSGVEHLGKYDRKEVHRALNRGGEVAIPIRKGIPLDEAVDALRNTAFSPSD
jgi:hypothetical protein